AARVLGGDLPRRATGAGRAGTRQGAVGDPGVRRRSGARGVRARLFLAHLAGRSLLRLVLLRLLLRVGRWRLLLGGGKADAGHKRQRERAGVQEIISHGGLLFVRSERTRSGRPQRPRPTPRVCARWVGRDSLCSGGRSADITAGAGVWFHGPRAVPR